ncbi:hypothetical protein Pcinc_031151 [Petrolisthes cinctipes]|uniref:Ammonium transporter AmtB-like domain-containing protein n=1 Tax=Petrolisthes cinctipes TaxID=88211 RepID=A0AAE1K595_PETCI|nr:hypothetical protein Pcinc_031151 [Petrolisthes cinctipes]
MPTRERENQRDAEEGRSTFTAGILHLQGLSVTIPQQPLKHPRTETLRREEGGAWKEGGETRKEGGGTERECGMEVANTNKGVGAEDWGGWDVDPSQHFAPARTHCHPYGCRKDTPRVHRSPRPSRALAKKTTKDPGHPMWYLTPTSGMLLLVQGVLLTLMVAFVRYNDMADAADEGNNFHPFLRGNNPDDNPATILHYSLVLTLILVLVCPGLKLAPLEDACVSAATNCLLTSCLAFQWAILCRGFIHSKDIIYIDIFSLLEASEVCLGLSVGVWQLLGRTTTLRLVLTSLLYVPLHIATALISTHLKVMDRGGSVCIHSFGAAFGAGLVWGFRGKKSAPKMRITPSKTTQLTSLIGTVVTCMLLSEVWAWKTEGDDHHRALLNTCLACLAAYLTAFPASSLTHPRRKVAVSDVECGLLGGCVAVMGAAEMTMGAWGSVLVGALASLASVLTRQLIVPGVWVSSGGGDGLVVGHGVGGVLGGLVGAVMAAFAREELYRVSVYQLYPALAPLEGSDQLAEINHHFIISPGDARSPAHQAALTLAALVATLTVALPTGVLTGLFLRLPVFGKGDVEDMISDECYWQLPSSPHSPPPPCHDDYQC